MRRGVDIGAAYVDNVLIFSGAGKRATRRLNHVWEDLTSAGLLVHEVSPTQSTADVLGLALKKDKLRISPIRIWRT